MTSNIHSTMLRPSFGDSVPNSRSSSAAGFTRTDSPTPRIQHIDGDVPPTLSPLDAFAAHSRRLARELEETRKAGERRISRLSPHIVTQAISDHQNSRPPIFRALSDGVEVVPPTLRVQKERAGISPQIAKPKTRPKSEYPRLSSVPKFEDIPDEDEEEFHTPTEEKRLSTIQAASLVTDLYGIPRTESPQQFEPFPTFSHNRPNVQQSDAQISKSLNRSASILSHANSVSNLEPPNPAFARNKTQYESSDDGYASSHAGSTFSQTRKLSSSSGTSGPNSPSSPYAKTHQRSTSNNSKISVQEATRNSRHLNFSHPLNSDHLENLKVGALVRRESIRSPISDTSSNKYDPPKTSGSFDDTRSQNSEGFVSGQASSYTHATYILPRGRMADRNSAVFLALSTPHFEWQEPMFPGTPPLSPRPDGDLLNMSPIASVRSSQDTGKDRGNNEQQRDVSFDLNLDTSKVVQTPPRKSSNSNTGKLVKVNPNPPRPFTSHVLPPPTLPPIPSGDSDGMSRSSRSDSTVRPTTARTTSNYQSLSADEHVSKAIELHQHGDLKESTYHLRIAAKEDHPTGMLLYALACRHGWGMRPNMREGVRWLRKAVDVAMLEIADDEDSSTVKPKPDVSEKKTHRAQFALSIYELGVSHLNGWGIIQDKALALRCFEIAGNWGDTDALTEAGFCYAEGIGCKKDLKKAAKFYRMAEQRGVNMVGNSWIHKDKYNDEEEEKKEDGARRVSDAARKTSGERTRNKSRRRSFFARKK